MLAMRYTAALLSIITTACSISRQIERPVEPSQLAMIVDSFAETRAVVTFASGGTLRTVNTQDVEVNNERLAWARLPEGQGNAVRESVPIEALRSLEYCAGGCRASGAIQGGMLGLLAGVAAGALVGLAQGSNSCPSHDVNDCGPFYTAGGKAALGAMAGGVLGIPVGALVGAAISSTTKVDFVPPQPGER
jgi:hypothetical protein